MMETREFSLQLIATCTSGVMTMPSHELFEFLDVMEDLLTFMAGEQPDAHQLKRFAAEATPYLHAQFEWLPQLDKMLARAVGNSAAIDRLIRKHEERYGDTLTVAPMPPDDHARLDSRAEWVARYGFDINHMLAYKEAFGGHAKNFGIGGRDE